MRLIGVLLLGLTAPALAADPAGEGASARTRPSRHLSVRHVRLPCIACSPLPFGGLRQPARSELPFGGLAPACPSPRSRTALVRKG